METGARDALESAPPSIVEAVTAGASEPMLVLDLAGNIVFANAAAETLLERSPGALAGIHVGHHIGGVSHLLDVVGRRRFATPIDSDAPEWIGPPPRLLLADGGEREIGVRLSGAMADGLSFICLSIRAAEAPPAVDARRLIEDAFARLAERGTGGLIVIDIDHFELVNQSLGRVKGDQVLAAFELALHAAARHGEVAARLEADRFALVTDTSQLLGRGDEILETIRSGRIEIEGMPVWLTASAGICPFERGGPIGEPALLAAEAAAQTAKQQGRDRCLLHSRTERRRAGNGVSWNDKIRTGIENGRLTPHLQPILELGTGRISHYELLARLRDGDGRLIEPSVFIPVAERLGLVGAIDRWAIRAALRVLSRWGPNPKGPRIAVNSSGRSVGAPQLLETVHGEVRKHQVSPTKLIIEVTETAAIGSIEAAAEFGDELRRLGVGFALDDFGSGFGTFYYLKHLPLDQVKIDGEFIAGISSSAPDQAFVRSLVAMARGLGIKTVAEFVTDTAALDCVRRLGVDYAQGYLIGRPQPLLGTSPPR